MSFKYVNIAPDSCRIRIIQNSFEGTGSTVVTNLLHGMFCPNCPYHHNSSLGKELPYLITKSHVMNYSDFSNAFGTKYQFYFISTERDEMKSTMYKRVDDMNKLYEEIKHEPFLSPHNNFYGIHGSHRNRNGTSSDYFSKHKK